MFRDKHRENSTNVDFIITVKRLSADTLKSGEELLPRNVNPGKIGVREIDASFKKFIANVLFNLHTAFLLHGMRGLKHFSPLIAADSSRFGLDRLY